MCVCVCVCVCVCACACVCVDADTKCTFFFLVAGKVDGVLGLADLVAKGGDNVTSISSKSPH